MTSSWVAQNKTRKINLFFFLPELYVKGIREQGISHALY